MEQNALNLLKTTELYNTESDIYGMQPYLNKAYEGERQGQ